ncbi:uncharacterized protein [Heliangelus exortis]|uniref:uncharacterized protein n=1 Tax=Heliangelus exortis TaxID=472823 RepID=UPI003A928299
MERNWWQAVKTEVEPISPAAIWASKAGKPEQQEASMSPDHSGDTGAALGAPFIPPPDESTLQGPPDETWDPIMGYHFWDTYDITKSPTYCFLRKLWKIVENPFYQSVWWDDDGKMIIISEELFEQEVLAWRENVRVLRTETMRDFIYQLELHGFYRTKGNISTIMLRAAQVHDLDKLLFYCNPFFQRDKPRLLKLIRPRAEAGDRVPAPSPPAPSMRVEFKRREKTARGNEGVQEKMQECKRARKSGREDGRVEGRTRVPRRRPPNAQPMARAVEKKAFQARLAPQHPGGSTYSTQSFTNLCPTSYPTQSHNCQGTPRILIRVNKRGLCTPAPAPGTILCPVADHAYPSTSFCPAQAWAMAQPSPSSQPVPNLLLWDQYGCCQGWG